jgi:hypothetical protein
MSASQSIHVNPVSGLREVVHYITGHNPQTRKAIFQEEKQANWRPFDRNQVSMHEVYVTSEFPPNINDDADIAINDRILAAKSLGFVQKGGTVCRIVDFAPQNDTMMHRTQSLDFGVILEGSIELVLDSGDVKILHRGDVAVQRSTMHGWRNPSRTKWARMIFFMQHAKPLVLDGLNMVEQMGEGLHA